MANEKVLCDVTEITDIADAVREATGTENKFKVSELSSAVNEVYEAGQQDEKSEFWDSFWSNIKFYNTTHKMDMYSGYNLFGSGWNIDNFKPIYPNEMIYFSVASRMMQMFNRNPYYNAPYIDLTEFCQRVDFSKVGNASYAFEDARAKNITVDFSNATTMLAAFSCGNGGGFENVAVKVSEKCTNFSGIIQYDYYITNFKFTEDSVVAANITFNYNRSLNKDSITSIINALSPTASGKTVTFSKTAVQNAFGTDYDSSTEWITFKNSKSNWTITLS